MSAAYNSFGSFGWSDLERVGLNGRWRLDSLCTRVANRACTDLAARYRTL